MSSDQIDRYDSDELGPGGNVYPIRPIRARLEDEPGTSGPVERRETSFEVDLDEPDDAPRGPVLVDAPVFPVTRRPIVPDALRGKALVGNAQRAVARSAHVAGYHTVRGPWYGLLAAFWALVGVFRLIGRVLRWVWQPAAMTLEQQAADANDVDAYLKIRKDAGARRQLRTYLALVALLGVAGGVALLQYRAPLWLQLAAAIVVIPLLARIGRPVDRPIIRPATVTPRFRKLNADIVLRAYYRAKLGNPDKEDEKITFASTMARVGNIGSQVVIDLPHGTTFGDAVKAKDKIASGIDVTEWQVFLTRDKTSIRRHTLLVLDRDPLTIPAGPSPLLDCKVRDIWRPASVGVDERRRSVTLLMMWVSILIGAMPRKGKTFTARLLALYAALDPYVKLMIADGKASPDWRAFALVADRMVYGTQLTNDGDQLEKFVLMLKDVKRHIIRTNEILSSLPPALCPEGKLTRELARDKRYPELYVLVLVIEEFQLYFETDDKEVNKEIAGLLSYIKQVGPSAGVIVISASQKPSGVGAGDINRLFMRYRDNHDVRIALKCATRDVSMAVLGGDAYGSGYDASALPDGPEYRGIGYMYGATDETPLARFHNVDHKQAHKILLAARKHREQLGLLSGEAAGEQVIEAQVIDPLADAIAVIHASEQSISWPRLAARLQEHWPERYDGLTSDAISSRLRGFGARSKSVRDAEFFPSGVGTGVARRELEQLAAKRGVLP